MSDNPNTQPAEEAAFDDPRCPDCGLLMWPEPNAEDVWFCGSCGRIQDGASLWLEAADDLWEDLEGENADDTY